MKSDCNSQLAACSAGQTRERNSCSLSLPFCPPSSQAGGPQETHLLPKNST